jgi:hypothetical protein
VIGAPRQVQRLAEQLPSLRAVVRVARASGQLQRQDRLDQTALRAVVQIPDDPPSRLVGARDDPRP